MSDQAKIIANFAVIRVQTMADNALRVVLEMPEYQILQMAQFAECQRSGLYLHGEFTITEKSKENSDGHQVSNLKFDDPQLESFP